MTRWLRIKARFIAIECKLAEQAGTDSLRGLRALADFYGEDALKAGFVSARTSRPYKAQQAPVVRVVDITGLIAALPSG
jgi:hypothetical protein